MKNVIMKNGLFLFLMAFLLIGTVGTMADEFQCVDVPDNHKIVFVPWIIPADQLTWEWKAAKESFVPEEEVIVVICDPNELAISPSVCSE